LEDARNAPDPVRLLREAIEAEKKKMQVLGDVAPLDGGTVVDALRTVASALPADLKVEADEFIMDAESIRMKVTADSFETADVIKQKIATTGYFADVQVKDVKQSRDGATVNFRLILTFGSRAAPAEDEAAVGEAAAGAPAGEAPAEAPAAEAPAEPAVQAPAGEPAAEQPAAQPPAAEQPAVQPPAVQAPAGEPAQAPPAQPGGNQPEAQG
jgi:hypothetical protein